MVHEACASHKIRCHDVLVFQTTYSCPNASLIGSQLPSQLSRCALLYKKFIYERARPSTICKKQNPHHFIVTVDLGHLVLCQQKLEASCCHRVCTAFSMLKQLHEQLSPLSCWKSNLRRRGPHSSTAC